MGEIVLSGMMSGVTASLPIKNSALDLELSEKQVQRGDP